jgi:pimeloyl-ACP methyl ester carboxylesterase
MTQIAVTSDGVRVAFDSVGSGPPLLLVHGLGDDRTIWRPIVERLMGRHTCVSLDLRGHGETTGASDFEPWGLDRDLAAVVAELGITRPLVVGHSLGGFAATVYAARNGTRAVVSVDQPLDLSSLAANVRALAARLHHGPVGEVLWTVIEALGTGPLPASLIERLQATRARLPAEAVLGIWRPLLEDDPGQLEAAVYRAISGIREPYLALHGSDPGPGYRDWLRARIPQANVEVWEGLGHFPHLIAPDRFAARIEQHAAVTEHPSQEQEG